MKHLGKTLAIAFLVGFGVVAVSDLLYPWQAHLRRNPEVGLINLHIGRFRLYGTLQFGVVTLLGVLAWRGVERAGLTRWLGPRPPPRTRDAIVASVLVSLGLLFGWCICPRIEHHASWAILLFTLSFTAVALAGTRHQIAAFAAIALAGTGGEIIALDPRIGWWTFTQPDLFGRVPAWELVVWGWAGIVIQHLAGGFNPAPGGSASAPATARR